MTKLNLKGVKSADGESSAQIVKRGGGQRQK